MADLTKDRTKRAVKLLSSALALTDNLIAIPPAVTLGQRGGLETAERGSEYFRQLAAKRKKKAGGHPKACKPEEAFCTSVAPI